MPSPNMSMLQGFFTSDGTVRQINLPFTPSRFEIFNQTAFDLTPNPGVTKRAWWFTGLADNTAFTVRNTNAAATDQSDFIAANGFRFIDPPTLGSPLVDTAMAAINGITLANPAVVTMTANHGLVTGDLVKFVNSTNMAMLSNMVWQVTVTGATTFTINLDTSIGAPFLAAGINGTVRRAFASEFAPEKVYVTGITAAANPVVTTSYDHGYAVDQVVTLHVPENWGMVEAEGLQGRITAVTATTFTLDQSTVGFTAFTFPTSAQSAAGSGVAHAVNIGIEQSNLTTDAVFNRSRRSMFLGSSVVGLNNEVLFWTAWSAEGNNVLV